MTVTGAAKESEMWLKDRLLMTVRLPSDRPWVGIRLPTPVWSPDEPVVDPPAPVTDPPAPEPVVDPPEPVVDPPEPADGDDPPEPPASASAGAKKDWRDRRIAKLTGQLAEARAKNVAKPGDPPPPAVTDDMVPASRVDELADAKAAKREFDRLCATAVTAGKAAFKDWDARIGELKQLVDGSDQSSVFQYNTMLTAAIETGQGPALLHALGGDLEEAERILALPPVKMAIELTKKAGALAEAAPGDDPDGEKPLPKPITPVSRRGAQRTEIDPSDPTRADNLTTEQWMTRRNAQEAARIAAGGRR